MDELVLRGNPAILKCHIPSFVSDFVFVEAWIDDEGQEYVSNIKQDSFGSVEFSIFSVFKNSSFNPESHIIPWTSRSTQNPYFLSSPNN
jgi:hypothetical protein